MRPSSSAYIVFFVISAIPGFLMAYNCVGKGEDCVGLLGDIVILIVSMIWIWSHEIIIEGDVLVSKNLFSKRKILEKSQIKKVRYVAGAHSLRDRFRPWLRIEIETNNLREPIVINRKILKKEDLILLRDFLSL